MDDDLFFSSIELRGGNYPDVETLKKVIRQAAVQALVPVSNFTILVLVHKKIHKVCLGALAVIKCKYRSDAPRLHTELKRTPQLNPKTVLQKTDIEFERRPMFGELMAQKVERSERVLELFKADVAATSVDKKLKKANKKRGTEKKL